MSKKLYRSEKGKILAGVGSGLAEHFSLDPVLLRLIFILLSLVNGIGIIIYVVLWLVLPRGIRVASQEPETWKETQQTASQGENLEEDAEARHQEEQSKEIIIIGRRSPFFVYLVLGLLPVIVGMVFLLEKLAIFPEIWFLVRVVWPAILVVAGLIVVVAGATRK